MYVLQTFTSFLQGRNYYIILLTIFFSILLYTHYLLVLIKLNRVFIIIINVFFYKNIICACACALSPYGNRFAVR